MAKNKIILFYLLFTLGTTSLLSQDPRDRIVETYTKELGTRELTGKNDGYRVEMYLASVNHKKGAPWCAAFVSWVFQENCIDNPKSAWSPAWFPKSKTIYTRGLSNNKTPQPADVFGIWFNNLKRIAHVGFINQWQSGSFTVTVEGNTNEAGSREGDGVYKKRRLKSQIYKVSRWL